MSALPQRSIVALQMSYEPSEIVISNPADNVNTTLVYHNFFSTDRALRTCNNLTYVDSGTTVIHMSYPYI
ncbi:MAG: hypothetical protein SOI23_04210 [Atopobiaceae bacterium]